uniref:Asp-tRNA(Asn)/Glu-tRNA(Gln) amidotransferase subunit GatC n=1 Tax=Acetatifactor sp. TaxID=1872090 RepID=UPI004057438C
MKKKIDAAAIDHISILTKLTLSEKEREQAKKDMEEMLEYIDIMSELDTEGIEPMSHVFPITNVFREDVEENGDMCEKTLLNAPEQKDNMFVVPKAIEA